MDSHEENKDLKQAVVSIDVGGTSIKAALMTETGVTVATEVAQTPVGSRIVDELLTVYDRMKRHAERLGYGIAALAAVTPGVVDEATGEVRYASNLQWQDVRLRSTLEQATQLPVAIGHDVRAAGLAEQLFGAACDRDSSVMIAIGTGIAAAVTYAGTTISGHANSAGELGHIPVWPNGEQCPCGQRGCLEVYASAEGIRRRYLARTSIDLTAELIVSRLGHDDDAQQIWDDAVRALALGLTTCTLLIDPEVFVIGGGLALAGDKLLLPLRAALSGGLAWRAPPAIELADLGSDAARIGAGVLAFRATSLGEVVQLWQKEDLIRPSGGPSLETSTSNTFFGESLA